ncbi:MAG: signal peptide peptidase SppA [Bacteriovoracaceae bacterium]
MSENRSKALLSILILVVIFFIILMIFSFYTLNIFKGDNGLSLENGKGKDKIAVVEVDGIIMESKEVIEKLQLAKKDKAVKAIIVRVDSPGGAVGPSQEIYQEIRHIDQDEKKGKPVYASFASIATSGGYYIGAAARKIYSNPGSLTGSIGVIMQFVDLSKLYEWAKIRPVTVKAGKFKDAGTPSRNLTAEEKELMNKMLVGVHGQFREDILKARKGKIKGDLEQLSQGQIFSGQFAFEQGLVDELGGLWEAGRKIHKELNLEGEPRLVFVKKKSKFALRDLFEELDSVYSQFKGLLSIGHKPMYLMEN